MEPSLIRLFAEGAHHVVSSLIQFGRSTVASIFLALRSRFSWLAETDLPAVSALVREVQNAMRAGEYLGIRTTPLPMSFGINPAIPDQYQYVVIGYLPNANEPDRQTTIPWTINSNLPLSYQEILDRAQEELNQAFDRGEKYMSASFADLHRRDIEWQRRVQDQYGGDAPIDIVIREIYRRE